MTAPTLNEATKSRLFRSVEDHRSITIIVGPTGSGKSTLIPATLLGSFQRILCTQPRRLAVVAVATRVANNLETKLGGNMVGYHVGQHNVSSSNTRLLFGTAGILLEQLRANGKAVLEEYNCIVIDECHERSVESDLCLSLLRELMESNKTIAFHLILMSATFDAPAYRKYFENVPGVEAVDTVTLETAESFTKFYQNVETHYLEESVALVPTAKHKKLLKDMKRDPDEDLRGESGDGRSLSQPLLDLIGDLIHHLDKEEAKASPFLVFAPTYRHLELIYEHLRRMDSCGTDLAVLHSSIDIEDCLRSMRATRSRNRRVLLASAIAESSITIPGVTVVIDTCRSLCVSWNGQSHDARTVWSSRSICDQRQGRTGRTCKGKVFRLVPQRFFFADMAQFETPQLSLSDCRNEAIGVMASTFANSDRFSVSLLNKAMDPPPDHVIQQAVNYLKSISACRETGGQRTKLVATEFGRLLANLPYQLHDSRVFLQAAAHGHLHEMLLLRTIMSTTPSPVTNFFGDENKSQIALRTFCREYIPRGLVPASFAHMSAYLFWDVYWNQARRTASYLRFCDKTMDVTQSPSNVSELSDPLALRLFSELGKENDEDANRRLDCGVWQWTEATDRVHIDWCHENGINPTSVRAIAETIDVTMKILFVGQFEPQWLRCASIRARWLAPETDWKGVNKNLPDSQMLSRVYGMNYEKNLMTCVQQFSSPGVIPINLDLMTDLIGQKSSSHQVCVHFLQGNCKFGSQCRKSHSVSAKRPVCKFFLSGSCTKGSKCPYSHGSPGGDIGATASSLDPMSAKIPLRDMDLKNGPPDWFRHHKDQLVLFGENDFHFASACTAAGYPPLVATDPNPVDLTASHFRKLTLRAVLGDVDATRVHANLKLINRIRNKVSAFAWNFPFSGSEEDDGSNEDLILASFLSVGLLTKKLGMQNPEFALTLQGDQLSRWSVLRSAAICGWSLQKWGRFDHSKFTGYRPCRANGDTFPYQYGRLYVFELDTAKVPDATMSW